MHRNLATFLSTIMFVVIVATLFSSIRAEKLKPEHIAQSLQQSIQIGGDLSQWDNIPSYPVELSNGFPAVPVNDKGLFSVAWDSQNLYVLGIFDQAKDTVMAKLKTGAPVWWKDDGLELFIRTDPFAKVPNNLHFAINPAGVRFKAYTATTDYQAIGRIEDNRWVLELAIPLGTKTLPKVTEGSVWGLKVGREHPGAGEFPIWPMGGDFNAQTNYGLLSFSKSLQETQTLYTKLLGRSSLTSTPIKSHLSKIRSYATYYGNDPKSIAKLNLFDLAVVQPQLSKAQLGKLHNAKTKVIAYVTIGELDPKSNLVNKIPKTWILGENKVWGSKYIDASQLGWQQLMLEEQKKLLKMGYDGVFLDTLDTGELFIKTRAGLVSIVQKMRKAYPTKIIVQNRGFGLLNQTSAVLDAVMFENFSSWYNFETKKYEIMDSDPNEVTPYQQRGLVILSMDYAAQNQTELIKHDLARAKQFGFIPYVSTILLDNLFILKP